MTPTAPVITVKLVRPETNPAWWIHWLNVTIAVVAFVGVVIHPGWTPPPLLEVVVAPVAIFLAVGSGLVFALIHHASAVSNLKAGTDYLDTQVAALETAARTLYPLIDRYPALETRLTAVEKTNPELARLLALIAPQPAPEFPNGAVAV